MRIVKLTGLKQKTNLKSFRFFSFDTESDPVSNKFKLISVGYIDKIINNEFIHSVRTFFTIYDFLEYLYKNKAKVIFCFNIKFDSVFLIDFFIDHFTLYNITFHVIQSNQSMLGLSFQYKDQTFIIKDFFAFARTSLYNIAKSLNVKTTKYPNFSDDKDWETFFKNCSIDELEKHCINDVKMLNECIYVFRKTLFDIYHVDFLSKKIFSLATLSMLIFRTNFIKNPIENSFLYVKEKGYSYELYEELYKFVKESYSGGYSDVFDNDIHYNVVSYDINSSYPYQTTKINFPVGKAFYTNDYQLFLEKTKKIPGFCRVNIYFEEDKRFIPVKFAGKFQRVIGKWSGVITSFELEYLKSLKIDFIDGYYFIKYDESRCLEKFCRRNYELKANEPSNSPKREIYKIILNSLTGKFGQNVFSESVTYKIINKNDIETLDELSEILYEKNETIVLKLSTEQKTLKNFMLVSWISLITASARIQLLEMINLIKHVICCDTDSVYFEKKYLPVDYNFHENELGGWKKEKELKVFRALAPKMYAGMTTSDKMIIKCKGIPKQYRDKTLFDKIMNWKAGESIEVENIHQFLGFKQGLRSRNATYSDSNIIKATYITKTMNPSLKIPIDIEEFEQQQQQLYVEQAERELMKNRKYLRKRAYSSKVLKPQKQYEILAPEMKELYDDFSVLDIDRNLSIEENAETLRNRIKDELRM